MLVVLFCLVKFDEIFVFFWLGRIKMLDFFFKIKIILNFVSVLYVIFLFMYNKDVLFNYFKSKVY